MMMTSFSARIARLLQSSGLALALLLMMVSAVSAQDTPVVTVEAGDFRDLAIIENGTRLLVADAASDHVRVYDITRMNAPTLITSVSLAGTPLALAGAENFSIAAIRTGGREDALEVIAPSPFNRRYPYMAINYIDVPRGIRDIILSPDGGRGIAIGDDSYTLLDIIAPEEIAVTIAEASQPIRAAALTADRAFIAFEGEAALEVLRLAALGSGTRGFTLEAPVRLGAPVNALAVSADGALIGALTDEELIVIDASDSTVRARTAAQASALRFIDAPSVDLLTLDESRTRIQLYDLQGDTLRALNALELSQAAREITTFSGFIFVTDGGSVNIFSVR